MNTELLLVVFYVLGGICSFFYFRKEVGKVEMKPYLRQVVIVRLAMFMRVWPMMWALAVVHILLPPQLHQRRRR